jgi:hypothetical protein
MRSGGLAYLAAFHLRGPLIQNGDALRYVRFLSNTTGCLFCTRAGAMISSPTGLARVI